MFQIGETRRREFEGLYIKSICYRQAGQPHGRRDAYHLRPWHFCSGRSLDERGPFLRDKTADEFEFTPTMTPNIGPELALHASAARYLVAIASLFFGLAADFTCRALMPGWCVAYS